MSKIRKTILIIGILIVAVAASLGTALALYATGSMKTDPIELVYVLREREKIYDGTPLKLDDPLNDIFLKDGKLSAGHYAKIEFLGSQTDAGTSDSDASIKIYDENGFNVTSDYTIRVVGAPLTVYKKPISVELPAQKVVYNGSKVLFNEYKISDNSEGGLCNGHKIYGSTDAELLNVGDTLPDDLTPLIFDVTGNDVTTNYEIVDFNIGEIEVIPRPVTVRPVSLEKVYDGEALVADIELFEGSLVEGQYWKYQINQGYEDSIINVSEIDTEITSLQIFDTVDGNEVEVTDNYDFTLEEGYLKITPRPLTVTAKSATFVYNGTAQSLQDETEAYSVEGLVEGEQVYRVSYLGSQTDVGVTENVIISLEMDARGSEDNYAITFIDGTIEVTPFQFDIRTFSAEKYYDGDALSDDHVDYDVLANDNHRIVKGALPSITNVGEISNAYTVSIFDQYGANCTENYNISYDYGTLTVKRLPVKVTLTSSDGDREKVYYNSKNQMPTLGNGNDNSEYFSVEPFLPEEDKQVGKDLKFTLNYSDFDVVAETRAMCGAGEYYYTVKFKDKEQSERQLYSNYELYVPESGILEIMPMPVTVTLKEYTEADAFVYSGKAVTLDVNKAITSIVPGIALPLDVNFQTLLLKEHFTVVAGEIIDAGTDYTYTVKIGDSSIAKNFNVTVEGLGIGVTGINVTVKPLPVTVTLKDIDRVYNGETQYVDAYSVVNSIALTKDSGVTVPEGVKTGLTRDDFEVVYTETDAQRINADDYRIKVEVSGTHSKNYDLTLVNLYDENLDCALLKVQRFKLEVTTDTQEFAYDGANHSSDGFTHGALANKNHKAALLTATDKLPTVCNVYDEDGNKEEVTNSFAVKILNGTADVTENYDIDYINGKLTVKPCLVTVTTGTASKIYDGKPLSEDTATIKEKDLATKFTAQRAGATPFSVTDVCNVANEFECKITDKTGVDVSRNFVIEYENGTLSITPLAINFTLSDFSDTNKYDMEYDGTQKTFEVGDAVLWVNANGKSYGLVTNKKGNAVEFSAEDFEIEYSVPIIDAGNYSYSIKFADEAFGKNFTLGNQTLPVVRIKKKPIEIRINSFTDGKALTFNNKVQKLDLEEAFDVIVDKRNIGVDESVISVADLTIVYPEPLLNAGDYKYKVKIEDDFFAKNFLYIEPEADVTIKKFGINVSLKDFIETYSGEEFVFPANAAKVITDGLSKEKQAVAALVTPADFTYAATDGGSILNAGPYTYTAVLANADKARNFSVTTIDEPGRNATVTIDKYEATVSLNPVTLTFNGEVQQLDGALALDCDTELLTAADFSFKITKDGVETTLLKSGEYEYEATLISDNFTLAGGDTVTGGEITVNKYVVTVTLNNFVKEYDGEEFKLLPQTTIFAVDGSMFGLYDFVIVYDEEIEDGEAAPDHSFAGEYKIKAELAAKHNGLAEDVEIVCENGELTIDKKTVTVTTQTKTFVYNGKDQSAADEPLLAGAVYGHYAVADEDKIVTVNAVTEKVVSNETKYNIYGKNSDGEETNVTENYIIRYVNGTLEVTPRAVTITTGSATRPYNGEPLKTDEITSDNLAEGHTLLTPAEAALPSVTEVDAIKNEYAISIVAETEEGVTVVNDNYDITFVYGDLEVKAIEISVTLKSAEKLYAGAGVDVTLTGSEVIEAVVGDNGLTFDDFAVVIDGEATSVGEYGFTVVLKSEENAKHYTILPEVSSVLTVIKPDLTVTLKDYENQEYTGKVQEVSAADIEVDDTAENNPDGITAEQLTFIPSETLLNAGEYEYTAEITDKTLAANYNLIVGQAKYVIVPAEITVTLKDYEETYSGVEYTVDVLKAIESIKDGNGDKSGMLTKSDFAIEYHQELRLVNHYREVLKEGETFENTETDEETGVTYKVLTDDIYTYGVELTDAVKRNNFNINIEGGTFKINKLWLTFVLSDLHMSRQDYDEGGYEYRDTFDVTLNVSLSTLTPLASGDKLRIYSANAERNSSNRNSLELYQFDRYELTNEGCYEFTNVNGTDAAYTRLVIDD